MAKAIVKHCSVCGKSRNRKNKTCGDQACINALRYAKYPPKPLPNCARCGTQCRLALQPGASRAFCSKACWTAQLADERKPRESSCEFCNSQFIGTNGKANRFCSQGCYFGWKGSGVRTRIADKDKRSNQLSGQCAQCGSDVYGRKRSICADGSLSKNVFCNNKCLYEYRGTIGPRRPCTYCGAELRRNAKAKNVYCNKECRAAHQKPSTSECVMCGVRFTGVYFRNGKWHPKARKTCGAECRKRFYREDKQRKAKISAAFSGTNSPNWLGGTANYRGAQWKKISKSIRLRDKHTCQGCGITETELGRTLSVHHKVPFNQFAGDNQKANKPSNLTALCDGCHSKAEWEWRRLNDVQLVLSLEDGSNASVLPRPEYPQDLSGLVVNGLRITGPAPKTKAHTTRWYFECPVCAGIGLKWRHAIVSGKVTSCGCTGKREPAKARREAARRREANRNP